MSNVSGASTGSSSARSRGRVFGVPKTCHCGEQVMELISKSNNNPCRRYFRCGYAVARKVIRSQSLLFIRFLNVVNVDFEFVDECKLPNDNHTFKWVDEAHLDEIEALKSKTARLEEKLEAVTSERKKEFEKELFERVEEALAESSSMTKKMVIVVVILCVVMVGFSKLF